MNGHILDVLATLTTAAALGCCGYLRGIFKKLAALERRDFNQDLHLLAMAGRLAELEEGRHR